MSDLSPDVRQGLPSMSSMARTMACPAWIGRAAAADLAPVAEKKWTADGTVAHDVLAGEVGDEEVEDNDDLVSAIRTCRIHEEKMLLAVGFEEYETHAEKRIFLVDDHGNRVASGQPDRVHIENGRFAIIDYKTGRKDVPSPSFNPQLIAYAVLVAQEYGVTEGYLGISYAWRQTPPMALIDAATLATWRKSILDALEAAHQPNPAAKAGPHCDYCPARWHCPDAWNLVRKAKETLTNTDMTADQIADHYDLAKHAEGTIKAFLEQVKARLTLDASSVPGLTLGKGSETKTIPGSESNFRRLVALHDQSKVLSAVKWTPASLSKSLTGGKGAKAAQKAIEEELADIITLTSRAPAIERI